MKNLVAVITAFIMTGCGPSAPQHTPDEAIFADCLAKAKDKMLDLPESLRTVEGFKIHSTFDLEVTLCGPPEEGQQYDNLIGLSQYKLTEGLERGTECAKAGSRITDKIRERVVAAYKSWGEDAFCTWFKGESKAKGDVWTRFWSD